MYCAHSEVSHLCQSRGHAQKTNRLFAHQDWSRNHFLGCWSACRRYSPHWVYGTQLLMCWNPLLRETWCQNKNRSTRSNERKSIAALKAWHTKKLLVKVRQRKREQTTLYIDFKTGSCQKVKFLYLLACSRNCKNSNLQPDAGSETSVKRHIQKLLQFTLRRMMNASCSDRKYSRMTRPTSEWDSIISRTGMFWKGKQRGHHLESSRQDQRNPNVPKVGDWRIESTLRVEDNGKGNPLGHCTRTCTQFQVRILRKRRRFFKPSPASDASSSPPVRTSKGENSLWTQELHFIWWVKVIWLQKSKKRSDNQKIHQLLWLLMYDSYETSNSTCLWFGHVCSRTSIERITRCSERLFVQTASRSAIFSHQ